tara:strand:- start:556 stop:864 length:309 start_codon:yes stop_codon:yes gene_type:complete
MKLNKQQLYDLAKDQQQEIEHISKVKTSLAHVLMKELIQFSETLSKELKYLLKDENLGKEMKQLCVSITQVLVYLYVAGETASAMIKPYLNNPYNEEPTELA